MTAEQLTALKSTMAVRFCLPTLPLWLVLVNFWSNIANANLIVRPTDTVVLVNQTTYFNCSTSARSIDAKYVLWYHYPLNAASREDVYDDGEIMPKYEDRFRIETNLTAGVFNLVVQRPSLTDAGKYECRDVVGHGDNASAELIVLEGNPVCESNIHSDGVVGQNSCDLKPDELWMNCRVTHFHGNNPPTLEWKRSNDESSLSLVVCNGLASCNLTQRGDEIRDGQSFVCQITRSTEQYGCSTAVVKVKYAVSSTEEITETKGDVKCYANTSQPCTYKWYNTKNEEVSADKILDTTIPGEYKCEAQCEMNRQNESCRFIAMRVYIASPDYRWFALLVLLPIAAVGIVVFYLYKRSVREKDIKRDLTISFRDDVSNCNSAHTDTTTGMRGNNYTQELPALPAEYESLLTTPPDNDTPHELPALPAEDKGASLLTTPPAHQAPSAETEELKAETAQNDAVNSHELELSDELPAMPIITNQDMVENLTKNEYFIDRGTSGAIYGPFRWEMKKCVLKQILFSPEQITKNMVENIHKQATHHDDVDQMDENIQEQADPYKKLDHPHLVKVFEVWFPLPALYIIMEYAEGKSLDKILRPKDAAYPLEPFPLEVILNWAWQIADGMKYLHYNNLVHRNLKAAHVLVMDVSAKTLKIGSHTPIKQHDHATIMSVKGTLHWMAPEYIRGEKFEKSSDVWSYGVTVWEILTRDIPFNEVRKETDIVRGAINKTLKLKIPDSCPKELYELLTDCWNYEVKKRPSFTEICDHLNAHKLWKTVNEVCNIATDPLLVERDQTKVT